MPIDLHVAIIYMIAMYVYMYVCVYIYIHTCDL